MGETFLININCSKVLADNDESHYTMFIDSTKMSIVYELVEWIRWIFSLENCFYITHDNSVIHELEDIQLLSRLKNFEIKPCGTSHCVHKKMYRILLKNLNLFVSWNGIEVHKYFLHKINQVDQKLTQENSKTSPMKYASGNNTCLGFMNFKSTKTDTHKNISPESGKLFLYDNQLAQAWKEKSKRALTNNLDGNCGVNGESQTKPNCSFDKKVSNEKFFNNSDNKLNYLDDSSCSVTENLTAETTKSAVIDSVPVITVKDASKTEQESSKTCQKYSRKYVKPFSLGEVLSNIRADFEKQNTEVQLKKNSPSSNSLIVEEENFDKNVMNRKDLFITENKIIEGRKRKRTRKRKKAKKEDLETEEITSPYLGTKIAACGLDIVKMGDTKPNHIRFDIEEDDNLMETESLGDEQNTQNDNMYEVINEQLNDSTAQTFSKTSYKELTTLSVNKNQDLSELYQTCSLMNNTENIMECLSVPGSQTPAEEKLDLDSSVNMNQPSGGIENFESNGCKPDLNSLLSLKEKFKNAVVIERFY